MSLSGRAAVRLRAAVIALAVAPLGFLVPAGAAGAASSPGSAWPPLPGVVFEEAAPVAKVVRVRRALSGTQPLATAPADETWTWTWPAHPGQGWTETEPETPTQTPVPTTGPVALRMAQANIKSSLSPAAFASDLREVLASGPDFVTLNEAPRRTDDQIAQGGYAAYRGTHSNWTRETPVLWRTDRWEQVAVGTRYLTTRQVKWGVRAVNWVTLRHRTTGAVVSVVSAHPAPTIGVTRGLLPQFMYRLAALVRELEAQGAVLVGGDLNMGYHGPLWTGAALASARLSATYDAFGAPPGGTGDHGGATIDYVLYQRDNGLTPTSQGTHELFSDHDAVWADFLLD